MEVAALNTHDPPSQYTGHNRENDMKRRIYKFFNAGFWAGFIMAIMGTGLYQDFIGKEAYLNLVTNNWVDIAWYLWLIPIIILFEYARLEQRREDALTPLERA